jgi:outer membrane protein assembly factor BamB
MVGGVLVDGAVLYVGTKEGTVYALDADSGTEQFNHDLDDEIWAAPARVHDGDGIYVPTLAGSLYRLSDTLEETWRFSGADGAIAQRPVVNNDRVYVGAFDNTFYAISADTGNEVWSIEADNWFWGAPVVADGVVYTPSLDGKVYALDAQTGEPAWSRPYSTGNQIRSGLVISGDALLVGSRDGFVHKVSLEDGSRAAEPLQVGTRLEADLTVDDDGNVYAISRMPRLYVIETEGTLSADFFTVTD